MESTPATNLAIGYGNGYGYPSPLDPAMRATIAMPAVHSATLLGGEALQITDPIGGQGTVRPGHRWMVRSAIAAGVIVAFLAGALAVGADRNNASRVNLGSASSLGASGSVGHGLPTTPDSGLGLGGSIPDPGTPILLTDQNAATTTSAIQAAPATVAPTTTAGPPTTSAPTTTPSTTPPSSAPPVTLPTPTTVKVGPTLPPIVFAPSISTFKTPPSGGCIPPFFFPTFITVSWTTQFATKVTLSIDGPGIYKTYTGSSGSDSVPFACPGTHTYLLTAYNAGGASVSKTITINP